MSRITTLTSHEISQLFESVANRKYHLRDRAMLALSIYAGMRVSEISSLKMSDVLDEEGCLMNEVIPKQRKNSKHPKVVYLTDRVMATLNDYLITIPIKKPGTHVFHADTSASFTSNGLTQWFFTRYRQAGLHASSNSGHKTFCRALASKGVSIQTIARLAGHQHSSTTRRYMTGLYSEASMLRGAVELVG